MKYRRKNLFHLLLSCCVEYYFNNNQGNCMIRKYTPCQKLGSRRRLFPSLFAHRSSSESHWHYSVAELPICVCAWICNLPVNSELRLCSLILSLYYILTRDDKTIISERRQQKMSRPKGGSTASSSICLCKVTPKTASYSRFTRSYLHCGYPGRCPIGSGWTQYSPSHCHPFPGTTTTARGRNVNTREESNLRKCVAEDVPCFWSWKGSMYRTSCSKLKQHPLRWGEWRISEILPKSK